MNKRILIVEDEPTNMEIITSYLEDAGYVVAQAMNGKEAWETLKNDANKVFGLVITDRRMPIMDGLELAKKIKKDPELRNIPVIMQTGATQPEEVAEGVQAGVYYYLTKPYEEDVLLSLTRSALLEHEKSVEFEKRLSGQNEAFSTIVQGQFNIQTPEEAENLALLCGSLYPRPELAINGLYELMMNAIEHGNLGIGYSEKNRLLLDNAWQDEVVKRLQDEQNKNKKVVVQFVKDDKQIAVVITDEGTGFDWQQYMEIEPSRATQSNGRGIAKANLICFDKLSYQGKGNQVQVISSRK